MLKWLADRLIWHKVGYMRVEIYNPHSNDYMAPVMFKMTRSGRRKYKIHKKFYTHRLYKNHYALKLWVNGGPFPQDFTPIDDGFREVVLRLVDAKLEGGKS